MSILPKTYIGRVQTANELKRMRSNSANQLAVVAQTGTIWKQTTDGEWIDTGKVWIQTEEKQGNLIFFEKTVDWALQGLSVYGKSKQNTTTGAQLFNYQTVTDNAQIVLGTGEIQELQGYWTSDYIQVSNGTTYTIQNKRCNFGAFYDTNKTYVSDVTVADGSPTGSAQYTPTQDGYIRITGRASSVSPNNYMICTGNTLLPWEPYTGGMSSPNPDYPQEIVSAGNDGQVDVTVCGANLLSNNINWTIIPGLRPGYTGQIVNNNPETVGALLPVSGLTSLYLSGDFSLLKAGSARIAFFDKKPNVGDFCKRLFSLRYPGKIKVYGYNWMLVSLQYNGVPNSSAEKIMSSFMLNVGDTAQPLQPYSAQQLPIPTPNGLPGIPVNSKGNWTDENGQAWVSDVVDMGTQEKTQAILQAHFDGDASELWKLQSINAYGIANFSIILDGVSEDSAKPRHISNRFVAQASAIANTKSSGILISTRTLYIRIPSQIVSDVGSFRAWLSTNPVDVLVPLSTPITTPLSAEELAAYAKLTSYDGVTNIFSDEEVGLEAELVTDVISKNAWFDPDAELALYYKALAGFESIDNLPMPHSRESSLVRKLLDSSYELGFSVNETSSRNERYLWDLINGTSTMLTNIPKSDTEKFLHVMIGGDVEEYPVVDTELDYWMDICVELYAK